MDYVRGWAWQQALLSRRLSIRSAARGREEEPPAPADDDDDPDTAQCRGSSNRDDDDPDVVLILEHDHVYTLGRGADENHLTFLSDPGVAGKGGASPRLDEIRRRLARTSRGAGSARLSVDRRIGAAGGGRDGRDGATEARERTEAALEAVVERLCEGVRPVVAPNGVPIFRVERGGECTYHGPGQLVCYPMLDLKRQEKADLHDYLRSVEEVVIRTLDEYGIRGARDDANTGVWVGRDKIAAVGVSSSRWITTHGFALNVRPDLAYFDTSVILPCGIDGRGVTSIDVVLRKQGRDAPTVHEVSRVVLEHLTQVFDLDVESIRDISATERNSPQLLVC
jgi:lipoyl(octanoyl) transferase